MATLASVCACGAVTIGPIHLRLMQLHQKVMNKEELYNDEFIALKVAEGRRYFPRPEVQPAANLAVFHQAIPFRRSVTEDYMPMEQEAMVHLDMFASLFERSGEMRLSVASPVVLKKVYDTRTVFVRDTGQTIWARCLNCDWMMIGKHSANFGSWHACGTRHRVAYSGTKFNGIDINLVPVPVRRTKTYHANFRQQQRMPCDIDPYKHPKFKYSRTPKDVAEHYKQWMKRYTPEDSIYPDKPWVDPYEAEYKKELDNA